MNSILPLILHFIGIVATVRKPLYNDQRFEHNPGIYFEKDLITTRTPMEYWKLVNYVDYRYLITNHKILASSLQIISKECSNFDHECTARIHLNLLSNRMSSLEDSLNHIHELVGKRTKRSAPLEFIGSISKALFGTLTSEDARYYGNLISQVSADNKELSILLANQTQIIKNQLGLIEDHFVEIDNNFEDIRREVNLLKTVTNELERKEKQMSLYLRFEETVIMLDRAITSFEMDVNVLIDGILFGKQGLLHPKLITGEQLIRSLEGIKEVLPYAEFPVATLGIGSVDDIIKASDIKISFFDNKLVIIIEIPLLAPHKFNAYNVYSLPIQRPHKNIFVSIQPQIGKLMVSQNYVEYYIVREAVPLSCKVIQSQNICKSLSPMRRIRDNDVCEVNLLLDREKTENCKFELTERNETYWMALHKKGQWLYSVSSMESCKVICLNEEDSFVLKGTGIISIQAGCTLRSDSVTFINVDYVSRSETYLYVPKIELNLDIVYQRSLGNNNTVSFDTAASQAISDSKGSRRAEAVSVSLSQIIEKANEISKKKLIMEQPINSGHLVVGLGIIGSAVSIIFVLCRYKWVFRLIFSFCCMQKDGEVKTEHRRSIEVTNV